MEGGNGVRWGAVSGGWVGSERRERGGHGVGSGDPPWVPSRYRSFTTHGPPAPSVVRLGSSRYAHSLGVPPSAACGAYGEGVRRAKRDTTEP